MKTFQAGSTVSVPAGRFAVQQRRSDEIATWVLYRPCDLTEDFLGNSGQVAHQPEMSGMGMPKSPIFSR
jgi:hypothetical protein